MRELPVEPVKAKLCKVCNKAQVLRYELVFGEDLEDAIYDIEHYESMGMCRECMSIESGWSEGLSSNMDTELEDAVDMDGHEYFDKYQNGVTKGSKWIEEDYYGRDSRFRGKGST